MNLGWRHGRLKAKGNQDEAGSQHSLTSTQDMVAVQSATCISLRYTACRYDVIWIQWALLYLTDGKQLPTVLWLGILLCFLC